MPLWEVFLDPKSGVQPGWPGCRLIARHTTAEAIQALVEADEAAIAAVRAAPGVASVAAAGDGSYIDDRTVYEVFDRGRRWRVREGG